MKNIGIEKHIYAIELHISLSSDFDQYRVLEQGCAISPDEDTNEAKKLSFEYFFKRYVLWLHVSTLWKIVPIQQTCINKELKKEFVIAAY